MGMKIWRRLPGRGLRIVLQVFSAVALIFEGYNQGVMGTVSATPGFIDMAQIGANGKVTNSTKQGYVMLYMFPPPSSYISAAEECLDRGLVAAYYFGAMWGCFIGGWCGDKFGRKRGVWIGSMFCMLGAALMAASTNANMFICARIIAGIGIGFINSIVPPWVSELSEAHNRGANFSLVFTANCRLFSAPTVLSQIFPPFLADHPLSLSLSLSSHRNCHRVLAELWNTALWSGIHLAFPACVHGLSHPHHRAHGRIHARLPALAHGQRSTFRGDRGARQGPRRRFGQRPLARGRDRAAGGYHRSFAPQAERHVEHRHRPLLRPSPPGPPRVDGLLAAADPAVDGYPGHRHLGRHALQSGGLRRRQVRVAVRSGEHHRHHRHCRCRPRRRPPGPCQELDALLRHAGHLALPGGGLHAHERAEHRCSQQRIRRRLRRHGLYLSLRLHHVQHRPLLDLQHGDLAPGDPSKRLCIYHPRLVRHKLFLSLSWRFSS